MPKMQGLLTWLREMAQESPLPPDVHESRALQRGGSKHKS